MMPKRVKREGPTTLAIEWDDGHRSVHTLSLLRRYCPCAGCRNEHDRGDASDLLPILVPGKNELRSIIPVGSYALQFVWGDGHQTGIYTHEYLRQLCECPECKSLHSE